MDNINTNVLLLSACIVVILVILSKIIRRENFIMKGKCKKSKRNGYSKAQSGYHKWSSNNVWEFKSGKSKAYVKKMPGKNTFTIPANVDAVKEVKKGSGCAKICANTDYSWARSGAGNANFYEKQGGECYCCDWGNKSDGQDANDPLYD